MGADIHALFQVYNDATQSWDAIEVGPLVWDENRDSTLFAVLADVRDRKGFKPICAPRGLPKDLNLSDGEYYGEGKYEYCEKWLGDHSHSWFYLHELTEWWEEHCNDPEHDRIEYFFDAIAQIRAQHAGSNMRMVFGFDS